MKRILPRTITPGRSIWLALLPLILSGTLRADGPPRQATATAEVVNGFLVGVGITDPGRGYQSVPSIGFVGGGGTGAEASVVLEAGSVVRMEVVNPGSGYTSAPEVVIGPPPALLEYALRNGRLEVVPAEQGAAVSFARRTDWQESGLTYRVEVSTDLKNWMPHEGLPVVEAIDAEWERVTTPLEAVEDTDRLHVRVHIITRSSAAVANFISIPEGSFHMGDSFGEGEWLEEDPVHRVSLSPYSIETTEVPFGLWREVYQWAIQNGYQFDRAGIAKGVKHPVVEMFWTDAVKWCNARSEMMDRKPCYYTNDAKLFDQVYRSGRLMLRHTMVDWNASGFRLPTEAEWENAARGGLVGSRFGSGDLISQELAVYSSFASPHTIEKGVGAYDLSFPGETRYHPDFENGSQPYTAPVGTFAPNGYGLHDVEGNVAEMCWDFAEQIEFQTVRYYQISPTQDPLGPDEPSEFNGRRVRGGGWHHSAWNVRVAKRYGIENDGTSSDWIGFRCVVSGSRD